MDPRDESIRALCDVVRRFPFGAAVAEQFPAGLLSGDLTGERPFVPSVVPFEQGLIDVGRIPEPRQFARPQRPLQGTAVDASELPLV